MDASQKKYTLSRFWSYIFVPLLLLTILLAIVLIFRYSANQTFLGSYGKTPTAPSAPPGEYSSFMDSK